MDMNAKFDDKPVDHGRLPYFETSPNMVNIR